MSAAPTLPLQVSPPEIVPTTARPLATDADVVALPVVVDEDDDLVLGPGAAEVAEALGVDLLAVLDGERATGRAGEVVTLPVPTGVDVSPGLRRVLLVGLGDAGRGDFRRAGAALARAVRGRTTVATTIPSLDPDGLEPFIVGVVLGSFDFAWRSTPSEHPPAERVVLTGLDDDAQAAVDRAVAVGRAGWRSRTLASVPSNLKNPPWLAAEAVRLAQEAGLDATVWDEERLRRDGFGGIAAVGQASATPPRLVRLDYEPARGARRPSARRTPLVVLVGKGITFDTGGISIKPGEAMSAMKRDMTGGAVVLATMAALADVGCAVRVTGLVPMAENAISGNALRPGDVLTQYGGRTTEVTNTDAEGRLVLADALAYAVAELAPAAVVDVATLTGGIKVALGQQVGGLFANDDALADAILDSGERSGEPLWRLPLAAAYEEKLSSKVADADNAPGGPQAIMAALFLQHFVARTPWAHLDIASTGDAPADSFEWSKGPTGFGARLLLDWLGRDDPLAGIR